MVQLSNEKPPDQPPIDVSGVRSLPELAGVLRALRRRHARRRQDGELTYRELAARTGWSTTAVAEYLTGKTLPPTDRFDALVRLLGASPVEQGMLATARDLVAEHHRRKPRPPKGSPRRPVPRQLPADVFAFTGRGDHLAQLDAFLAEAPATPTAVVISAVSGTAGVGKTALAVRWAHRMADRFPDGQLYLNLRGYDPEQPVSAPDALTRLLGGLGVSGADVPFDVEDRAARWRSELAGRRMLIVLDNAATVGQVRPLLPGSSSCVVLVTSRDSLAGLVARDGARRIDLDLLPLPDAVTLLRQLIGPRAEAEPDATAALAELCARLPLALRVAAELATSRPSTTLGDLVVELADRQTRLDLMDAGGDPQAAITGVFSWSVQQLPGAVARVFRLLGLHPGPELDAYAVAALAGTDPDAARRVLDALARAHLVHPTSPGRYQMHDLLRAYTTHLALTQDPADACRAAQQRLFDTYRATATAAMALIDPAYASQRPSPPAPPNPVPDLADPRAAHTWLDTERPNLIAVAAHTASHGWPAYTVDLSVILFRYLDGGHFTDAITVHSNAHQAARLTGDRPGQAHALFGLGITYMHLAQQQPAADYLRQALTLYQRTGDRIGQSRALNGLGNIERLRGRPEPAADYLHQALDLAERCGNHAAQAQALINLGISEAQRGRYDLAAEEFQQALLAAQRGDDPSSHANAVNNLGLTEQRLGRFEAAAGHQRQALAMFRQLGNRRGEANTLDNLGIVHLSLNQPERAAACFTQALAMVRETGDREGQAWALNGLGETAHATGRLADAAANHTDALSIATEIGALDQQARAHAGLGHVHRALGDATQAGHHYQHALAAYTAMRAPEADDIRALLATTDS